ncbi:hypothetical protein DBR00_11465 [Pseudomonas sp. HMWF032]|uniref:hypothetical protein n=1 Tax=Pseudomonas sp. HMWF032 TaxID=2056866 RepID=UPI000D3B4E6F|nr:hypothetical protein [Pseudomonas sp. HMWF032]PTS83993.1 hypothetical protein DBR00_11465 [Pseudomonas sp. HMWF032]PTT85348.1 hypothetical protein DBR41_04050 [Pseudomonas sp. HMWF010]
MSWLNGLAEEKDILNQTQQLEFTSEKLEPGFFTGSLDVIGPSLVRGGLEGFGAIEGLMAQGSGNLAAMDITAGNVLGGGDGASSINEEEEAAVKQRVDAIGADTAEATISLRPDPASVGMAGQIIGEAAAILPRTALATLAGGPVLGAVAAGAPAGFTGKYVGIAEGLDESTATLKGVIDAATIGVGAILPAAKFVKPVLGDLGIAIGANVGLGMAGRGTTAELLEGGGYHAQAAQYRAMDGLAIATDAVLGAAFFGIGRASMRRPSTEQINAALTERNAQHFDVDTAPGAPINPRSAVAHQDALRTAIEQLSRGEPVVLPDSINSAEFVRAADDIPPIAPGRDQALASARQDLAPALRSELEQEAAGILPNVKDVRAELAMLSKSIDGLDATFRVRAKEFQQQGQSRKQAEASARETIASERLELTDRQAALNDSLTGNRTAEQARAEINALDRGEIPARFEERLNARADEIAQGFQRKPLASGVADANKVLSPRQINERTAREEIDSLVRDHEATLPREPDAPPGGKPVGQKEVAEPDAVATKGATPATDSSKVATPEAKGAAKSAAGAEPPELQLLRDAVNRSPDAVVNSGFDVDGNPVKVKAADALAEIEAEYQVGVREAQSYMAAITCMLRG